MISIRQLPMNMPIYEDEKIYYVPCNLVRRVYNIKDLIRDKFGIISDNEIYFRYDTVNFTIDSDGTFGQYTATLSQEQADQLNMAIDSYEYKEKRLGSHIFENGFIL